MADVTMPQLGETVTEGTITKWFKKVGDEVRADEPLFEVSTDKVDTEVPSPVAGFLTEIRAGEGDIVTVGAVIAVVAAERSALPAQAPAPPAPSVPAPAASVPAASVPAPPPPPEPVPAPSAEAPSGAVASPAPPVPPAPAPMPAEPAAAPAGSDLLLSPVVRRLVAEHGLDPSKIQGSGVGGRITREDVLDAIDRLRADKGGAPATTVAPAAAAAVSPPVPVEATPAAPSLTSEARSVPPAPAPALAPAPTPAAARPAPAPVAAPPSRPTPAASAPAGRDEAVRLSKIRKLTGDHMVMSRSVAPHAFSVVEVDYENVERVRRRHKDAWRSQEGFSLTFLPFIARAVVDAIAQFPRMNASVGDGELVVHRYVDLGVAVDLDYEGLLVPVVRDAESKRLRAVAREVNDLAARARARKLSPDEILGGTFTLTNNGSAGSVLTAAIINQPQVAIISTDAITRKPVVVDVGGSEGIAIHSVGNLAMSWDHRAFDGAYAANFLVKVKQVLETRDWEAELA